jgi:hypothetical protein
LVGEGIPVVDTWGIACIAGWGLGLGLGWDRVVGVGFLPEIIGVVLLGFLEDQDRAL